MNNVNRTDWISQLVLRVTIVILSPDQKQPDLAMSTKDRGLVCNEKQQRWKSNKSSGLLLSSSLSLDQPRNRHERERTKY